jgi:hypothetical protein
MPVNNSKSRREQRRSDAETRQRVWDERSTKAKMREVKRRVGDQTALASNEARKLEFTSFTD